MSNMVMTGRVMGQLLEAAASGCECLDLAGTEVSFAESLRSLAESAYELDSSPVGLVLGLEVVGAADDEESGDGTEDES